MIILVDKQLNICNQQNQAKDYFHKNAKNWNKIAKKSSKYSINVIKQRNAYVIRKISERKKTNWILDVGCGTGDLILSASRIGVNAIGIDFAEDMINHANKKVMKTNCTNVRFICDSIFNVNLGKKKFDLICANGFIEYISVTQLNNFLNICNRHLNKRGSLILGSRNKLFNLFSLNKFSRWELEHGNIKRLFIEALGIATAKSIEDIQHIRTLPPIIESKSQPKTSIDVNLRIQYTPVQLIKLLKKHNFVADQIWPIHVHGVVPSIKQDYPELHTMISNLLENYVGGDMRLIPMSSSFMIHGTKR